MVQVIAGLKGHIEEKALLGSKVVAILNLKPAKLAGQASEAMLLAADAPGADGKELVRTLIPPGGWIAHWNLLKDMWLLRFVGGACRCCGRSWGPKNLRRSQNLPAV